MSDDQRPEKPNYTKSRADRLKAADLAAKAKDRERQEQAEDGPASELAERVERLEQAVQRPMRSTRPEPPQPIVWLELSEEEYADIIGRLRQWMRSWLFPVCPVDARVVLPCWDRHAFAREALGVAWQLHEAAWSPGADPMLRGQWLANWRPQLREQLKTELASCSKDAHNPNQYPPDPAVIGEDEETAA